MLEIQLFTEFKELSMVGIVVMQMFKQVVVGLLVLELLQLARQRGQKLTLVILQKAFICGVCKSTSAQPPNPISPLPTD